MTRQRHRMYIRGNAIRRAEEESDVYADAISGSKIYYKYFY